MYCEPFDFLASLIIKELEMQFSYILKSSDKGGCRWPLVFVGFWNFSMKIPTLNVKHK